MVFKPDMVVCIGQTSTSRIINFRKFSLTESEKVPERERGSGVHTYVHTCYPQHINAITTDDLSPLQTSDPSDVDKAFVAEDKLLNEHCGNVCRGHFVLAS